MPKLLRRVLTFSGIVWTATIVIILYLTVGPLIKNLWASYNWEKIPCRTGQVGYTYAYKESRYHGTRESFWDLKGDLNDKLVSDVPQASNNECYVNPSAPYQSVLRVDAHKNLGHSMDRLIVSALILGVAIGVTRWKPPAAKRG